MEYGIICLLPIAVVIVTAIVSKRAFEPLALGSVVGYIILYKTDFFGEWLGAYQGVIADNAWYWLVFFLFGSVVKLCTVSGGATGFSKIGARIANTRCKALLVTWILGCAIFIDDFLNNLAIGTAMKGIADKLGISRHFLAYIINSTGACVCVLVPVSTWAVFMQGLYEQEGIGEYVGGDGLDAFIAAIPYMWYPMAVILVALLFVFGILKPFGPMKKEEQLAREAAANLREREKIAAEKAATKSARMEKIEQCIASYADDEQDAEELIEALHKAKEEVKMSNCLNFIIPILVITFVTIFSGDMLTGIVVGLVVMFIMYIPQKLMTVGEYLDNFLTGMYDMMIINALVSAYFCLQTANDALGVAPYVIDKVYPLLNAGTLPLVAFVVTSFLTFVTGSFWGMPAVAFPIFTGLAGMYGCNPLVVGAAMVSGGAFGSSACFYGDAVTLVCASTEIKNYEYAKTVLPLLSVPLGLTIIAYIIYGFVA